MTVTSEYEQRLKIPIQGGAIQLYSPTFILLATAYRRIVIGDRGPYIEFDTSDLVSAFHIPENEKWRIQSPLAYYTEIRTIPDNIKVYFQKKLVTYADYKLGMFYISPFDLCFTDEQNNLIKCIEKKTK